MTQGYDWSQFSVHMYYYAALERVFDAWSTAAGLQAFFIGSARHQSPQGQTRASDERVSAGDQYEWEWLHPFQGTGEFLECVPEKSVAFTFGSAMQVRVEFAEVEGAIEVRLTQSGCGDDNREWSHLNCRSCWIYFMTNLKSVLEHGSDLRDHERPHWNDSVSIGWSRP